MDRDPTSFADFHSHLVPGVDDGARTLEEAVNAVERMTWAGIRKIITTPHIDGSLTLDPHALDERLSEVSVAFARTAEEVGRRFPEVEFKRGHEVMLDIPDVDFKDPRMRLAGTSFVLLEWPRLHLPPGTTQVLRRIREDGYLPIVAHPERYNGIDLTLAAQWRDVGAFLQVNYGSLDGRYGSEARVLALRLLRRGMVDYLASDFHGRSDKKLYKDEVTSFLKNLGGDDVMVHLCLTNPARIFREELPLPVPTLPAERGFWARVKKAMNPENS